MRNNITYFTFEESRPTLWDSPAPGRTPLHVHTYSDGHVALFPREKLPTRYNIVLEYRSQFTHQKITDIKDFRAVFGTTLTFSKGTVERIYEGQRVQLQIPEEMLLKLACLEPRPDRGWVLKSASPITSPNIINIEEGAYPNV